MADTQRGGLSGKLCSDCGEIEAAFRHWGDLVPKGKIGFFCMYCWNERREAASRGESPKPLGVKPLKVPKEFIDKAIKVTTQSGSVYEFGTPNETGERSVFCNARKLKFNSCRIFSLAYSKDLWLQSADGKSLLWATTPVVLIE